MAGAGAEYLHSIFGTEKDKVNCPFYFKIGACRHGDKCERRHNKPNLSQTLILVGMYTNPLIAFPEDPEKNSQDTFDEFYEDVYDELANYGEIEELNVCDNVCDHMLGNVYVKYTSEEEAQRCLQALTGRFYGGRPIIAEFSPVTDFREASCRQYDLNECNRGGRCNFIHLRNPSSEVGRDLFGSRWRSRRDEARDERRGHDRRGSDYRRGHDRRYDDRRDYGRYDDRRNFRKYDDRGSSHHRRDDRKYDDRRRDDRKYDDRDRKYDDRDRKYDDRAYHRGDDTHDRKYDDQALPPVRGDDYYEAARHSEGHHAPRGGDELYSGLNQSAPSSSSYPPRQDYPSEMQQQEEK